MAAEHPHSQCQAVPRAHFTSHACSIHHHLGVVLWRIWGAAVLGIIHVCDVRVVAAGDSIVPPAA